MKMQKSIIVFGTSDGFNLLDKFENLIQEAILKYYASDIFREVGFTCISDFQDALKKTSKILNRAKIPVNNHIRIIFRDQNHQIYQDWKLSSLVYHLIKINGNSDRQITVDNQIKMHFLYHN
jgi:hypothetical protein